MNILSGGPLYLNIIAHPFSKLPPILPYLVIYLVQITMFYAELKPLPMLICTAVIGVIIASLLRTNGFHKTALLVISFVSLGMLRIQFVEKQFAKFPFHLTKNTCSVVGKVQDLSIAHKSRFPYCSTLEVWSINAPEGESAASHFVQFYSQQTPTFGVSDTLYIPSVQLKVPSKGDFQLYLKKEGISATCFKQNLNASVLENSNDLRKTVFEKRSSILDSFQKHLSEVTYSLFSAIFMGNKADLKRNKGPIEAPFKKWGIVHYLARSGLHLVIIVSLCELFFRLIPMSFALKNLFLIFLVLLYYGLTWPSVSFLRALIIFLMYKVCQYLRAPDHFLNLLLLCCLLLLLYNPLYLLFLDFQLSFGLTFTLAWLNLFKTVHPE